MQHMALVVILIKKNTKVNFMMMLWMVEWHMLYSQVLTQEQAISLLLKSSNNKDIKEVFPVPHSPCNPTVIGVSLRVIKLDNAKLYFSTFNKSSDLSEIGLSVIELIKNILLLF